MFQVVIMYMFLLLYIAYIYIRMYMPASDDICSLPRSRAGGLDVIRNEILRDGFGRRAPAGLRGRPGEGDEGGFGVLGCTTRHSAACIVNEVTTRGPVFGKVRRLQLSSTESMCGLSCVYSWALERPRDGTE